MATKCDCIYTFPIDFESNGLQSKFFNCNRLQRTLKMTIKILSRCISQCGENMRRSTQNMIVYTLFRLIWIQTAYDCVDNFKIKKNYDREMRE